MNDLIEWLRAQLDEDERVAREMKLGHPWPQHVYATGFGTTASCCDADRLLREIDAKRRVINAYVEADAAHDGLGIPGEYQALLHAVRLLAAVYADRPGWREEWRIA